MRHPISSSVVVRSLAVFLGLAASACVAGSENPADLASDEGAAAPAPETQAQRTPLRVLALGPVSPEHAPVLARIARDADAVINADPAADTQNLDDVQGVLLDLAAVDADSLAAHARVLDAARSRHIPIVIENVTDSSRMSAVVGAGITADLVYINQPGDREAFIEYFTDDVQVLAESARAISTAPGALHRRWLTDDDSVATVAANLAEKLVTPLMMPLDVTVNGTLPANTSYVYHFVVGTPVQWSPGYTQTATMTPNFKVGIYVAAENPGQPVPQWYKYLVLDDDGVMMKPGTMVSDYNGQRMYFQDQITVAAIPLVWPTGTMLQRATPETYNGEGSFTYTTGFSLTAGADSSGPSVSAGYDSSTSATVTLTDFEVINQTGGLSPQWFFKMAQAADGTPYDNAGDLCRIGFPPKIAGVPYLAKSTLAAHYEAVYRMPSNAAGSFTFNHIFRQQMVSATLNFGILPDCSNGPHTTMTAGLVNPFVTIDLSKVAVPAGG